jgi:hypothetical protein
VGYKSRWSGSDTKTTDTVSKIRPQRRRLTQQGLWLQHQEEESLSGSTGPPQA